MASRVCPTLRKTIFQKCFISKNDPKNLRSHPYNSTHQGDRLRRENHADPVDSLGKLVNPLVRLKSRQSIWPPQESHRYTRPFDSARNVCVECPSIGDVRRRAEDVETGKRRRTEGRRKVDETRGFQNRAPQPWYTQNSEF